MSFQQPFEEDLEAGESHSVHYSDYPEFETLTQLIDNSLYNINNNYLVSIRNLLQHYEQALNSGAGNQKKLSGASQKISELSSRCTLAFKDINESIKKLNSYLNECENNHEDGDTISYLKQKESISVNLVKNTLSQFQRLQEKYNSLQKQFVGDTTNNPALEAMSEPSTANSTQQQIQIEYEPVNAEELEQQTLLIEEREREIQQISQDTQEINEIFLNLQDIILEQQFQIDNIEDNIMSYHTDVRGAASELRKAERYQKRAGGRMICCLLILVGVFGSVILTSLIF